MFLFYEPVQYFLLVTEHCLRATRQSFYLLQFSRKKYLTLDRITANRPNREPVLCGTQRNNTEDIYSYFVREEMYVVLFCEWKKYKSLYRLCPRRNLRRI